MFESDVGILAPPTGIASAPVPPGFLRRRAPGGHLLQVGTGAAGRMGRLPGDRCSVTLSPGMTGRLFSCEQAGEVIYLCRNIHTCEMVP